LREEIKHPWLENVRETETNPAEIGKHRFSDAIPRQTSEAAAKQTREAKESEKAHSAEASNRERMVDIGRGNQQAGRQGQ
jgi:hypothetical protein